MHVRSAARRFVLAIAVVLLVFASFSCSRVRPIPLLEVETVIVWAPHPDDETFGIAQTVHAHSEAGIRVVVVLLTDGEDSAQVARWVGDGRGEDLNGDGTIDAWDFGLARRAEFRRAAAAIGVEEVLYFGAAESRGEEGLEDGALDSVELGRVVREVVERLGPGVGHLAPVGHFPDDPYRGDFTAHPDHDALFVAVSTMVHEEGHPAYFYKVYEYFAPEEERQAPLIVVGDEGSRAAKRAALDAYAGIAKTSTPEVWQGYNTDPHEYLVPPSELR